MVPKVGKWSGLDVQCVKSGSMKIAIKVLSKTTASVLFATMLTLVIQMRVIDFFCSML